jgi:uncharacterized protein
MAKFILFVLVLAAIYLLVHASSRRSKPPPAASGPESMAQCARCGVHFPRAEVLDREGRDYCCEEHRRLGVKS